MRALVAAATVLALALPSSATAGLQRAKAFDAAVVGQVNALRAERGLKPMRWSVPLAAAATDKSLQMARLGYFGHDGPGGAPFWRALSRRYRLSGYASWRVGQNIAWSTDTDAAGIVRAWLASPPHRKVLFGRFREFGVSTILASTAPGVYGDRAVTIVTLNTGFRR